MTKKQQENENKLKELEKEFEEVITLLRAANNERNFKKKHSTLVLELKYLVGGIHQKLRPKTGPLQW